MTQNNQGQTTRRFQSSRFDAGFDCELPDDVREQLEKSAPNLNEKRSEFARPKRPRILERPLYQPPNRGGILKLAAAVAIPTLILVCVISSWQRERTRGERAKSNQAISQSAVALAPIPTPGPTVSRQASRAIAPRQLLCETAFEPARRSRNGRPKRSWNRGTCSECAATA